MPLEVRGDQGGVHIRHQRCPRRSIVVRRRPAGQLPRPCARRGPRGVDHPPARSPHPRRGRRPTGIPSGRTRRHRTRRARPATGRRRPKSPPNAESSRTSPGSHTAIGLRHDTNAADKPAPRQPCSRSRRAAPNQRGTPPACRCHRPGATSTAGRGFCVRRVLLVLVRSVHQQDPPSQFEAPFAMINIARQPISVKAAGLATQRAVETS